MLVSLVLDSTDCLRQWTKGECIKMVSLERVSKRWWGTISGTMDGVEMGA